MSSEKHLEYLNAYSNTIIINALLQGRHINRAKNSIMCGGGCGPVHKPFACHSGARRSFPGGDNATPQTAKQTADKGCTIVHLKWCLQVDIPEAQKPRAKTIGSPHNLPHQW